MSKNIVTVEFNSVVDDCMELYNSICLKSKVIFKDKSTNETLVGLMLISTLFEQEVQRILGEDTSSKIKKDILSYVNKDNK